MLSHVRLLRPLAAGTLLLAAAAIAPVFALLLLYLRWKALKVAA